MPDCIAGLPELVEHAGPVRWSELRASFAVPALSELSELVELSVQDGGYRQPWLSALSHGPEQAEAESEAEVEVVVVVEVEVEAVVVVEVAPVVQVAAVAEAVVAAAPEDQAEVGAQQQAVWKDSVLPAVSASNGLSC